MASPLPATAATASQPRLWAASWPGISLSPCTRLRNQRRAGVGRPPARPGSPTRLPCTRWREAAGSRCARQHVTASHPFLPPPKIGPVGGRWVELVLPLKTRPRRGDFFRKAASQLLQRLQGARGGGARGAPALGPAGAVGLCARPGSRARGGLRAGGHPPCLVAGGELSVHEENFRCTSRARRGRAVPCAELSAGPLGLNPLLLLSQCV